MSVLSDAPGWWERARRRREFCAPDAPWLMAKEVGWPVPHANTLVRDDDDFLQGARECSAYLLATGLAPDAVYGIGVRAVWPDDPGRFSVVHIALAEVVEHARAYQATSRAPREPRIGHGLVTGAPVRIIRRDKGQVQPTVGEAIALAIVAMHRSRTHRSRSASRSWRRWASGRATAGASSRPASAPADTCRSSTARPPATLKAGRASRYLESIGVRADDLDVGHPEGKIVFSRGRLRITRH